MILMCYFNWSLFSLTEVILSESHFDLSQGQNTNIKLYAGMLRFVLTAGHDKQAVYVKRLFVILNI